MEPNRKVILMNDRFNLERFLSAQQDSYSDVLSELAAGYKLTHWMWFIFPQVAGLGSSYSSVYYALHSRAEARAYLEHPVLGARLTECANLLLATEGLTALEILGSPDDLKLRSCMTLFACIAGPDRLFAQVLGKFYDGLPDQATLAVLDRWLGEATG